MAKRQYTLNSIPWTLYKYPLKNTTASGQWIPIFVWEIPQGSADGSFDIEVVDGDQSYNTFESVGIDDPMPFWVYTKTKHSFLEVYQDDNIFITCSFDNDGRWTINFVCSTKDSSEGGLSSYLTGESSSTAPDELGGIALSVAHFTKDDVYAVLYHSTNYGITTLYTPIIDTPIVSEKNKGLCHDLGTIFTKYMYPTDYVNNTDSVILHQMISKSSKWRKRDKNDPNDGGGNSTGGGGGGDGDIGGDTNSDDGLPDISALDSGLLTAYSPTVAELQALGRFLWSDSFDVNTFKKLFNDPFDTLLGLSIVPVQPQTSGSKNILFGNLNSGVSAAVVSNQWVSMDMGTLHLTEVWKGALDYAPSTGVCIYLPFIGMRQLNVNDVMGSSLHLIYKFDVLTGAVIAQIYVNHDNRGNPSQGFSYTKNMGLCYEFIGQCGENIPLASQDFTNTIRAAISGVSVAAGAAASVATGNPALGIAALTVGAANAGMQANTPTVERGGHLSGSASIMGYSQPFLIVERPHQCKPSRYYSLRGIPSQVYTSKLANCTGFTQITDNNNIHASGAQDAELEEIERLLTSGVYFPNKARS